MSANVLVVFWSRFGETERLALNAAVGAVQGRALIRLRWLKEAECDPGVPGWLENRERMDPEYIQPRVIDLEWAQGLVLASPARIGPEAKEWEAFFGLSDCRGKRAGLIVRPRAEWEAACRRAGLLVVPDSPPTGSDALDAARAAGRAVADSCDAA